MSKKRVLIIGAGASGLIAGIFAAQNGAAVTILEQNEKPGKKICATGNGKCNLTNLFMPSDAYRGEQPDFVKKALENFSVKETISFFESLGVFLTDKKGYLYPRSGQAQSIVDVLCMKARSLGVKIKTNEKVLKISKDKKSALWKAITDGWTYEGEALILANGSKASNISGSDGSGYIFAESTGHKIITPLPALTALKCKGKFSGWSGVRTEGKISLYCNGKLLSSQRGELQLTDYGVSGIPVFQISRYAIRALNDKNKVTIKINFLPELSSEEFRDFLKKRKELCPYKNEKELLTGIFPEKLIKVIFSQKDPERSIKEFSLEVTGYQSFEQAQVCQGGVSTLEIDPVTMESKICKELYTTGELLDIDGTCGGYNLQWAWSSGVAAGIASAKNK